jgi:hypothetical protein
MTTYYLVAALAAALLITDHLTGTAGYQRGNTMFFATDHFDIFSDDEHDDEHGSTSDYWDAYADALESRGYTVHDADGFSTGWIDERDYSADLFAFDTEAERDDFLAAVFETDSLQAEELDEIYYEGVVSDADVDVWRSL